MAWYRNLLHGKEVSKEDVATLENKLLFDRVPVRERYVRFFILLSLSTVIAAYGVVSDSVAVIIGAMIIAPLMTPIMAISLSAVTGDGRNIVRSVLTVAAGTALVVGLSYFLTAVLPGVTFIEGNSSIASRVSPRLIDLIVALAAGAAGAFATGREDVSDALPGVAIAVSLVPPLAVVGVCLSAGEPGQAWGAFMLFLTNFLAIVAAGLIVFAVMGFSGTAIGMKGARARKWAITAVVVSLLVISVPLGVTSYRVAKGRILHFKVETAARDWLDGSGYAIYRINADANKAEMIIAGSGEVPPLEELLSGIETGEEVEVEVEVVPKSTLRGTAGL